MKARRTLVGSLSEVVFICLSVAGLYVGPEVQKKRVFEIQV